MNINLFPKNTDAKYNKLYSHLDNYQNAIRACVDCLENEDKIRSSFENSDALFVDYNSTEEEMDKNDIINDGQYSFFISPVNEKKKYSREFNVCYGAVVSGIDKKTKKKISILVHIPPSSIKENKFVNSLKERINELQQRSESKTIDAVIFGGESIVAENEETKELIEHKYDTEIQKVSNILRNMLNFKPVIISQQSNNDYININNDFSNVYQHFYFDTEKGRLYIFKSNINTLNKNTHKPRI